LHSAAKNKLLIVDDDPALLASFAEFLLERGYAVRTASNGFEALAEIHDSLPDILLSDLNMPRMSGFDLLAVVSRRFPNVRLIAMAGTFTELQKTFDATAHCVFHKGTGSAALLSAIESAGQ
jgi:CheY-like chemotaxis protein